METKVKLVFGLSAGELRAAPSGRAAQPIPPPVQVRPHLANESRADFSVSLQGNCEQPPAAAPPNLTLLPRQCVLTLPVAFLDFQTAAPLWLDSLVLLCADATNATGDASATSAASAANATRDASNASATSAAAATGDIDAASAASAANSAGAARAASAKNAAQQPLVQFWGTGAAAAAGAREDEEVQAWASLWLTRVTFSGSLAGVHVTSAYLFAAGAHGPGDI